MSVWRHTADISLRRAADVVARARSTPLLAAAQRLLCGLPCRAATMDFATLLRHLFICFDYPLPRHMPLPIFRAFRRRSSRRPPLLLFYPLPSRTCCFLRRALFRFAAVSLPASAVLMPPPAFDFRAIRAISAILCWRFAALSSDTTPYRHLMPFVATVRREK